MDRNQLRMPGSCISVLCLLILVSNIPGCSAPAKQTQRYEADIAPDPDRVAGRRLLANTSDYVLYANDAAAGMKLRDWLDDEIAAFRAGGDRERIPKGIVFAIEPGDEPDVAVGEWEEDHVVGPYRYNEWSRFARCSKGHYYCLRQQGYFRESYLMTPDEADRVGLLGRRHSEVAWICLLTTDEYFTDVSGKILRETRGAMLRAASDELEQAGALGSVLASLGLSHVAIHALGFQYQLDGFRSTDMDLMRIQRRDTIHTALANAVIPDESARKKYLTKLHKDVDQAWHDRWLDRPFGRMLRLSR